MSEDSQDSKNNSSTTVLNIDERLWQEFKNESKPSYDDYKVKLIQDQETRFPIVNENCSHDQSVTIKGHSGIVYAFSTDHSVYSYEHNNPFCKWEIIVPENYFVAARFQVIPETCPITLFVDVYNHLGKHETRLTCNRYVIVNFIIYSTTNRLIFKTGSYSQVKYTPFFLFFTTVARNGRLFLPVTMTSSTTGCVTSAGFGGFARYSPRTNATHYLTVPFDHVVMISFSRLDLSVVKQKSGEPAVSITFNYLELYSVYNGMLRSIAVLKGNEDFRPKVFNASHIVLKFIAFNHGYTGFKMDFSFHPFSRVPTEYGNGSFDCSGSNYNTIKQHVHCDLIPDCVGGEDEGGHCPFSSQLCEGSVAVGAKCFRPFWTEDPMEWHEAEKACRASGGRLATMRSSQEMKAVESIYFYNRRWLSAWVGLRTVDVEPSYSYIYGREWMWTDGIVGYSVVIACLRSNPTENFAASAFINPHYPGYIFAFLNAKRQKLYQYVCEYTVTDVQVINDLTNVDKSMKNAVPQDLAYKITNVWSAYQLTECPSGHLTFSFMSCETASTCGTTERKASCTTWIPDKLNVIDQRDPEERNRKYKPWRNLTLLSTHDTLSAYPDSVNSLIAVTVSMFTCADEVTTLLYSFVCDYLPHCSDLSDETFCHHSKCPEFTCISGQCVFFTQRCDNVYDCLDKTDEGNCPMESTTFYGPFLTKVHKRLQPPTLIDFDGQGSFTQLPLQESENCPETHFRCQGTDTHCLPVYVRCNGVYDCPGREDENECEHYTCPGFYRCRDSRVCVHADHMCNGWPKCPQRDDELYCTLTCPSGCLCQGMAVVCNKRFQAAQYPEMRYLDAGRSKMKPAHLFHNTYLIWLSMSYCNIDHVSGLKWPNLKHFDLSHNALRVVSMESFFNLPNLRSLIIKANPLVSFAGDSTRSTVKFLKILDLSHTMLQEFDSSVLSCYPYILELNISHCPLDKINNGFKFIPNLIRLDLSGSPVSTYPRDVLKKLDRLQRVFASNYKFCCKVTLPEVFDERLCFAPEDELSSCDDLLKSNVFRGCLWMFSILGVIGNVGCFLFRSFSKNPASSFNIFVTNLTVADLFMGVYLVMIGTADEVYRGRYLWHDKSWANSTVCTVAGFLSLLSSEMSAFIICLITLDRFIVLTFPFSDVRFKGLSLAVTCVLIWACGLILASVPFFPMATKWQFYGQTGICIPLPITRGSFPGYSYSFGVMIVLNFVLFVLIATGQLFIYWSVRVNSMTSGINRKNKDFVIARRLFTVAASDFLCWFPIGLLGLLSSNGVPVSSDISVATAIFILPMNSTLNPFLYTFNVVMEKRNTAQKTELIKMIESMILSQETPKTDPPSE